MKSLIKLARQSILERRSHLIQRQRHRRRQPIGKKTDPLGTVQVTCSALNVRAGVGKSAARIGGLVKGQTAAYYEEKNGWLRIQYGAQTGWICAEYTTYQSSAVKPENPEPKPKPEEPKPKPEEPKPKPEEPKPKPEEPKPKPEEPKPKPEEPKPQLTPYQQLLKDHPEIVTNQDLINHFYYVESGSDGTWGTAASLAQKYGVDFNALTQNRNAPVDRSGIDGGEPAEPPAAGDKDSLNVILKPQQTNYTCGSASGAMAATTYSGKDVSESEIWNYANANGQGTYVYRIEMSINNALGKRGVGQDYKYKNVNSVNTAKFYKEIKKSINSNAPALLQLVPSVAASFGYKSGGHYCVASGVFMKGNEHWLEITDPYSAGWRQGAPKGQKFNAKASEMLNAIQSHSGYVILHSSADLPRN